MKRALIFGRFFDLGFALPSLLQKSGFEVDVVFNTPFFKKSRFVKNIDIVANDAEFIKILGAKDLNIYDLIVPWDDEGIKMILASDLALEKKLKLLPITGAKGFEHIFSKIGLSKALSVAGILTPEFLVADGVEQAKTAAKKLGYPVMTKVDASYGGRYVVECNSDADFDLIAHSFFEKPILVQKKIIGEELDLSGFYRDKKLIYFGYAIVKKVVGNCFGPSSLRLYKQIGAVEEELFLEMQKLGEVLEINGFANITSIQTADKKRYFIEVDLRPNAWVEFMKFIGDDPAKRIAKWFSQKESLSYPVPLNNKYPTEILLPYFDRMTAKEILFNRYKVWKYMPYRDFKILFYLLFVKFRSIKIDIKNLAKPKISYKKIKRFPTNLIRLVLPKREDRLKIRNIIKRKIIT